MNEKEMVSINALNKAFERQLVKREMAPEVSGAVAYEMSEKVAAAPAMAAGNFDTFFAAWDKYYPTIVSLLGWASWFFPPKAIIKNTAAATAKTTPVTFRAWLAPPREIPDIISILVFRKFLLRAYETETFRLIFINLNPYLNTTFPL